MDKNAYRMTVQMNTEEKRMIDVLKSEHSINLSGLIKKCIKDTYDKLESIDNA